MGALGDFEPDAYLTDGEKLYRVIRAWPPNGQVLLEDAGDPSLPAVLKSMQELVVDGLRPVRSENRRY